MSGTLVGVLTLIVVVLILVIVAIFALARQIGILHTRLAPAGALMTSSGPELGEFITRFMTPDIHGKEVAIGGASESMKSGQLLLFVSPMCPICKQLIPVAKSMARSDNLELIFASDGGEVDAHLDYMATMDLHRYPYIVSMELGLRFEVGKLPYAVVIDDSGKLRSKGLVNSREHLESMVLAMQSGYESIQDYLIKKGHIGEQVQ